MTDRGPFEKYVEQAAEASWNSKLPTYWLDEAKQTWTEVPEWKDADEHDKQHARETTLAALAAVGPLIQEDTRDRMVTAAAASLDRDSPVTDMVIPPDALIPEEAVNWFALGQRLSAVALTTGVSRGAILSYGWPECHKKGCRCHHANEDEVVGLVLKRVGDHLVEQLLANDALRADILAAVIPHLRQATAKAAP